MSKSLIGNEYGKCPFDDVKTLAMCGVVIEVLRTEETE